MVAAKLRKPSPARSRNMAAIRATDTKPEMIVRRLLHGAGFRYRLHRRDLPGKPDLSLPKWNAVIEVHGCFFHSHDCHLVKSRPEANREFWAAKLDGNVARDRRNADATRALGIRRLVVWQCALSGKEKLGEGSLLREICQWLQSGELTGELSGK
ncbi:DNA mismatch endonuclease Vsr [Sphingomonas sp. ASV193]|uniref:very short patch repair endonuclease n=1 Tax=Sphingomonas sp. ASV193 TaxID=3144405 RepID=UPI0032E8D9D8